MRVNHWRIVASVMAAGSLSGCAAALLPVLASGVLASSVESSEASEGAAPRPAAPPPPLATPVDMVAPVGAGIARAPAPVVTAPLAALQLTSFDPAFARFASFALAAAPSATAEADGDENSELFSALLADPVELDGARKACLPEQAPAVLIDLDPAGDQFTEPSSFPSLPEHAAALAALREAGITIAWISQSPITRTGTIRSVLEGAGLDPRGQDVLVLARDPAGRKQALRDAFGSNSCILAIAGDERTDFDERFRYLRNPAAGARLETLIGEGPWFLIRNIFSSTPSTGTLAP